MDMPEFISIIKLGEREFLKVDQDMIPVDAITSMKMRYQDVSDYNRLVMINWTENGSTESRCYESGTATNLLAFLSFNAREILRMTREEQ